MTSPPASPSVPDPATTGLLLIAHGSARTPNARRATERLAAAVSEAGGFAEVAVAFLKQEPSIADALAAMGAQHVVAVPNFAADGYFTRSVIPAALAEADPGGARVRLTAPVGTHPRIEDIIRRRAAEALRRSGAAPEDVALLLVGHGSGRRPGVSSAAAHALADRLQRGCGCAGVHACFIEESPLVADWPALTAAPVVIALPLLVAEGLHGSEDLPPLFGLTPDAVRAPDAPSLFGPQAVAGRQVWYWRGLATTI